MKTTQLFLVKMIVGKVMSILVDKIKIDKISDYVFNDNVLEEITNKVRSFMGLNGEVEEAES